MPKTQEEMDAEDELNRIGHMLSNIARDLYKEARRASEGRIVNPHALASAQTAVDTALRFVSKHRAEHDECPRHLHHLGEPCSKPLRNRKCPDHGLIREKLS